MKSGLLVSQAVFLFATFAARGQGTFLYDQQSLNLIEGSAPWAATYQPMGQSFVPSLSSVGFVELNLFDADALNSAGSTLSVNIRANSINGTILGTSQSIFAPDLFAGTLTFLFSVPVSVIPGNTYYIQTIQSGDNVSSYITDDYLSGTEFLFGSPIASRDLWFREGIVVPEPSFSLLILLGAVVVWRRQTK